MPLLAYADDSPSKCPRPAPKGQAYEACGSATARAANVIHFRLDASLEGQKRADKRVCIKAAHSAFALAKGIALFRDDQVQKHKWTKGVTYHTRYDGDLAEEALFALMADEGKRAEILYGKCGGDPVNLHLPDTIDGTGYLYEEMRAFKYGDPAARPRGELTIGQQRAAAEAQQRAAREAQHAQDAQDNAPADSDSGSGGGESKKKKRCAPSGGRCGGDADCCHGSCVTNTKRNLDLCN